MRRYLGLALLAAACGGDAPTPVSHPVPADAAPLTAADLRATAADYEALLAAEDRRAPEADDLAILTGALTSESASLRRAGARAVGRLERPDLAELLWPLVEADPSAVVRAEAANAIAQSVRADEDEARRSGLIDGLLQALDRETASAAKAAMARAVARIPPTDASQVDRVVLRLAALGGAPEGDDITRLGAARAAFAHLRTTQRRFATSDRAALITTMDALLETDDPVVRRTAAAARRSIVGAVDAARLTQLADDSDAGVRREAMMWAAASATDSSAAPQLAALEAGLADPDPEVRIAAVQGWAAQAPEGRRCAPLLRAADGSAGLNDPGHAVAMVAIDALDDTCADVDAMLATLGGLVDEMSTDPVDWHRATRALLALAPLDAETARAALPVFSAHSHPFVRAAAATAAGPLESPQVLARLARDPDANVREAAILSSGASTSLDVLLEQLERTEPHLLRSTATRLAGGSALSADDVPGRAATTTALLASLARVSDPVEATMRDARVALLGAISETGTRADADRLRPYLTDPDPRVATRAATILQGWGAPDAEPAPTGLPTLPVPSFDELAALEDSVAVITMANGDRFTLTPLPFEAPTNAARFFDMARAGVFDGLTWHRVVPNFVLQGGSPGANEYAGHGAFTRDEIGLVGHFAGTIGISTRGRDTGDGQLFINLVDNLRLDHDYTVFGYLTEGLDRARAVRPGDVIEHIRIRAR